MGKEIIIKSPVQGKIISTKTVKDPVFAQEIMGKTMIIMPETSEVVSPITGKLKVVFPTGHAYGIKHKSGVEILLHLGIDTVELNGEGFEKKVTQGSKIKEGAELSVVDWAKIKKLGKAIDTAIVFTDLKNYELNILKKGEVSLGEEIAKLTKK